MTIQQSLKKEAAMRQTIVYAGNDVHQDFIEVAIYRADESEPFIEKRLVNDRGVVQKFYKKLVEEYDVRACYEAGGCGYVVYRWLKEIGAGCDVIAPSLIPKRSGDRIKTDKRDAKKIGRLYRSGELVRVHVPNASEEADRALARLREQVLKELNQSRQYILKFLQLRGYRYEGSNWTQEHEFFLKRLKFENKHEQFIFDRYLAMLEFKKMELREIEVGIEKLSTSNQYAEPVKKLRSFRGIDTLSAMTIITEVIDFKRFGGAKDFMGFLGLVPSQHSSGSSRRLGSITGTGNRRLRRIFVEAAWHYRHKPAVTKALKDRQEDIAVEVKEYSWKTQQRLSKKYWRLANRKEKNIATVAVARELSGFVWSLMARETDFSRQK
jgi:transposase